MYRNKGHRAPSTEALGGRGECSSGITKCSVGGHPITPIQTPMSMLHMARVRLILKAAHILFTRETSEVVAEPCSSPFKSGSRVSVDLQLPTQAMGSQDYVPLVGLQPRIKASTTQCNV